MIRPELRKIASAPNDLKMTLNAKMPKVPLICWITAHESQISLRFGLRSLFFQIIEVFYFSIGYNGEFAIFEKKALKIRNSKFQKSQPLALTFSDLERLNSRPLEALYWASHKGTQLGLHVLLIGKQLCEGSNGAVTFHLEWLQRSKSR